MGFKITNQLVKMIIKVQLPKAQTTSSAMKNLKTEWSEIGGILTFHAHSDTMKSRVLDMIMNGEEVILSTVTKKMDGEWLEIPDEFGKHFNFKA